MSEAGDDVKRVLCADPPLKESASKYPPGFIVIVVVFALLLVSVLYQNNKLAQKVDTLNAVVAVQSQEHKNMESSLSDIEWSLTDIESTVDTIESKIDY